MSLLLISHDSAGSRGGRGSGGRALRGQVVESGPAAEVLLALPAPLHPRPCCSSLPPRRRRQRRRRLTPTRLPSIEGTVPDRSGRAPGCRFADRCPVAIDRCRERGPGALAPCAERGAAPARALLAARSGNRYPERPRRARVRPSQRRRSRAMAGRRPSVDPGRQPTRDRDAWAHPPAPRRARARSRGAQLSRTRSCTCSG